MGAAYTDSLDKTKDRELCGASYKQNGFIHSCMEGSCSIVPGRPGCGLWLLEPQAGERAGSTFPAHWPKPTR